MAKKHCDCAGGAHGASGKAAGRPRVVNSAGDDLGPFNWETAVGSDIARGADPALALQRGQILKNVVLSSGEFGVSTDAIRYIMEGARHVGAGGQPSESELEKFGAYLKRQAKPRIEITPRGDTVFGLKQNEASIATPYSGYVATAFSRQEGQTRLPGARSLKLHADAEQPSMLNAALWINLYHGYADPFPAFRPGKGNGVLWGEPDDDGLVDEDDVDLPGAPDSSDVYVRTLPDVPRHNGCIPMGTLKCRNRGTVFQPIRTEPPLSCRFEFGDPQVTVIAAHTVKVVITITAIVTVEMYQKMYRRIDCCCEFMGAKFDCWSELGLIGETPKDVVDDVFILAPMEHVSRDWGEWTVDLFADMLKKVAEAAGGAIGGSVGGAAGDAAKDALKPVIDQAKQLAEDAARAAGFGNP